MPRQLESSSLMNVLDNISAPLSHPGGGAGEGGMHLLVVCSDGIALRLFSVGSSKDNGSCSLNVYILDLFGRIQGGNYTAVRLGCSRCDGSIAIL